MKSKRFISLSLMLGLTAGMFIGLRPYQNTHTVVVEAAESVESYYSGISDSLTGTALKNALHNLNSSKRKTTIGYNSLRTFFAKSDKDPNGSNKIIGFYDNALIGPSWDSGNTWNREHVWPKSRGGSLVEGDAHMTRPASTSTNGDRGSKGYSLRSYDPGQFVAYYRGAASRIILYAAIADTSLNLVEDPINTDKTGSYNMHMGCLSEMLAWNLQYQPSDTSFTGANDLARRTEINRNNFIHRDSSGQGNRNPFIDHPEYACRIWGDTNNETRKVCGAPSLSLSSTSMTVYQGHTAQISGTSSHGTNINWSSSDTSILSISQASSASGVSVTVTGRALGSATITATTLINGETLTKECAVTVSEVPPLKSVSLNATSISLSIDRTYQLKVIPNPTAAELPAFTWTSSDAGIATVSSDGLVTAKGAGSATITAKSTDPAYTLTCAVTVSAPAPAPSSGGGCGGNVITTSVILSTLSVLGIGLILIKRKFIK